MKLRHKTPPYKLKPRGAGFLHPGASKFMAENPITKEETKVILFSGKGGVGKTTIAAATALSYALEGEKTLIISTDPTPSLSHIFEMKLEDKPAKVTENLCFSELGFEEIKQMWEAKFGREVYHIFSSFVNVSYEEFTDHIVTILPGLTEEFMVDYIKELSQSGQYQRIIWDTAPLGQTLELFKAPSMFTEHLKTAPRIYSQLKMAKESKGSVFNIIDGWRKLSLEDMSFLKDKEHWPMIREKLTKLGTEIYDRIKESDI